MGQKEVQDLRSSGCLGSGSAGFLGSAGLFAAADGAAGGAGLGGSVGLAAADGGGGAAACDAGAIGGAVFGTGLSWMSYQC